MYCLLNKALFTKNSSELSTISDRNVKGTLLGGSIGGKLNNEVESMNCGFILIVTENSVHYYPVCELQHCF